MWYPFSMRQASLYLLMVRIARRFFDVRVMGLAAEMTYYSVLSLVPLTAAIGSSLGFLGRFAGQGAADDAEAAMIWALEAVFSPEATSGVVAPLVRGLLSQERAGFALGSSLISLLFASRVFRSAIDTLDSAYRVEERRGTVALWALGVIFALLSVVVVTAILSIIVLGPLLGGGRVIAARFGLGVAFDLIWTYARWPAVFVVATAFLALLYRVGPNAKNTWRDSLPGAIFGTAGILIVAVFFRLYVEAAGLESPVIDDADDAVALTLHAIGVLMAWLFWMWLSTMAALTGAVVNAELVRPAVDEGRAALSIQHLPDD